MRLITAHLSKAFTLIELVVVMGVLTILLAITLVAINPGRQFAQANDTQRKSDINAILNAVHQYAADNKGALPAGIDTTVRTICRAGGTVTCPANNVNLCTALVSTYIADIPRDPQDAVLDPTSPTSTCAATGYNTQYTIVQSASGNRITVSATPEITPPATLSVTR